MIPRTFWVICTFFPIIHNRIRLPLSSLIQSNFPQGGRVLGLYDVGKEVLSTGRANSQQNRSERTDQWIAALRKRRGTEVYNGL